jgi:hypothetical protein
MGLLLGFQIRFKSLMPMEKATPREEWRGEEREGVDL